MTRTTPRAASFRQSREVSAGRRPGDQVPSAAQARSCGVEIRGRALKRAAHAQRQREQRRCQQHQPQAAAPEPMDEKNEERQEDVELLLDGQRPGVEQREGRRRRHEIAGAAGEIEIGDGEGRGQERAGVAHELARQHVDIGQDGDRQHHHGQRRRDAPDPPLVGRRARSSGRDLVDDHRSDEIARDPRRRPR
jgi:hypothetical protein